MDRIFETLGEFTPFVVALVVVVFSPLWAFSRHAVTIVHEGGHALAALLTGRQLTGIRLHSDTSGLTLSRGKPYGVGMVVTAAAGYLTPPVVAFLAAVLLANGHLHALGLVTLGAVAVMLVFIRNVFGALLLVGTIVGLVWLDGHSSVDLQAQLFYLLAWVLILGNVRTVAETARNRSGRTDVDALWRLTRIPRGLWILSFYAITATAALLVWNVEGLGSLTGWITAQVH